MVSSTVPYELSLASVNSCSPGLILQTAKGWELGGTCQPYVFCLLLIPAGFHSNTLLLWTQIPKEEIKKSNKYRIKSPPDLQSKFELQQKAKKAKKAETEAAQKDKERGEEVVMVSKQGPAHSKLQEQMLRHR